MQWIGTSASISVRGPTDRRLRPPTQFALDCRTLAGGSFSSECSSAGQQRYVVVTGADACAFSCSLERDRQASAEFCRACALSSMMSRCVALFRDNTRSSADKAADNLLRKAIFSV